MRIEQERMARGALTRVIQFAQDAAQAAQLARSNLDEDEPADELIAQAALELNLAATALQAAGADLAGRVLAVTQHGS